MEKKYSSGFTLIEVMIAIAVSTFVIAICISLFKQSFDIHKKQARFAALSEAHFAISQAISNPGGCKKTFADPGNINPLGAGTEVQSVYANKDGGLYFDKNLKIARNSMGELTVKSMTLKNFSLSSDNKGIAEFEFVATEPPAGIKEHKKTFSVGVVLDNDNNVIECYNIFRSSFDCVGGWSACTKACDGGTRTFTITSDAKNGGKKCEATNGSQEVCNVAACSPTVHCVGGWGACSKTCGGGTSTYQITTPASGNPVMGNACVEADGASKECNTDTCAVWVTGAWSACSGGSGAWEYSAWGSCAGGSGNYTYSTWGACSKNCGGGTQVRSVTGCSAVANSGSQTRTKNCKFTPNSGTQTRTVICQKNGSTVADSECQGAKPATTQNCTPTNSSLCGTAQAISQTCTPTSVTCSGSPSTSQACNSHSCCQTNCYCTGSSYCDLNGYTVCCECATWNYNNGVKVSCSTYNYPSPVCETTCQDP